MGLYKVYIYKNIFYGQQRYILVRIICQENYKQVLKDDKNRTLIQ